MTMTKQMAVRISTQGGAQMKAELLDIGRTGQQAFGQLDRAGRSAGAGLQNAAFQIGDVFTQITAGTDPMRAVAIQLPQLLGGFGLLGAVAGAAASVLPLLFNWLFDIGGQSETTADQIKTLEEAVARLRQATEAANASPADLMARYGSNADQMREILEIQRQIAEMSADRAFAAAARGVSSEQTGGFLAQLDTDRIQEAMALYGMFRQEINEFGFAFVQTSDMMARAGWDARESLFYYANAIETVAENYGVTKDAAERLVLAMHEMDQADTTEARAAAAQRLSEMIFETTNGLKDASPEALALYEALVDAAASGLELASIDMAGGIGAASAEAAALAQNLGISLATANALARLGPQGINTNPDPSGQVYSGRGGDPRKMGGSGLDWQVRDADAWLANWKPPTARGGGGGGGGGGGADRDRQQAMREAERLFDSTRTSAEKYAIELAKIDKLLAEGFITQDTYNRAVGDLKDKYGEATGAGAFFKEMNLDLKDTILDVVTEGSKGMDRLRESIKRAAMEYLLFGSGPFGSVLGGGFGGLLGGLGGLLSFEGGGPTPSGPRAGGLDGRGGFLAMLHPDETVYDHRLGSAGMGGMQIEVKPSPYFDVRVTRIAAAGDARSARVQQKAAPSVLRDAQARGLR